MKEKVLFSWSGGKDSGLVLHELKHARRADGAALPAGRKHGHVSGEGLYPERVFERKYETAMKEALLNCSPGTGHT